MSKLLTVFGATGTQGGSVIASVLADPQLSKEFKIRGITRDTTKPAAEKLKSQGVELVSADMDDEKSLEKAVAGSYAVFAVTNFWEKMSRDIEVKQGKAIADAVKAQGVKLYIFSTLKNVTKISGGKYTKVAHFDGKADITDYIESIKGNSLAAAYFMPGFYMDNFKTMVFPGQDGKPTMFNVWDANTTHIPTFDPATDSGTFVAAMLKQPLDQINGREVQAVSEWLTPQQVIDTYNKVAGKSVVYQQIPAEAFQSNLPMPKPIAEELTENMELVRDFEYYGTGAKNDQGKHDAVLGGTKTATWESYAKAHQDWNA